MRLIRVGSHGKLSVTSDMVDDIPPYAILSHTWGPDATEVTLNDLKAGLGRSKDGYAKIRFCAKQAQEDKLQYIWVDTCCIDKANHTELSEAITSMFRWYRNAAKCYVYLSDVSGRKRGRGQTGLKWELAFRQSRWFTRGWTLQELLAPISVDFFTREGERLGDKSTLEKEIHRVTDIPIAALHGAPLCGFSVEERMQWAAKRETKKREDKAYCLLGIFDVFIPLIYGEGNNAFTRLKEAIDQSSRGDFTRHKEQLLESLNHGSPFTRVNNISTCTEGTFEWILDNQSSDLPPPVIEFREWLRYGEGIFWIKGKPGSGKSTLMKFFTGRNNQHLRSLQWLESWAAPRYPAIFSFYFWLSDASNIQNSFHGFLCHLLHQMLSKTRAEFASGLLTIEQLRQKRRLENWDTEELETMINHVACYLAKETPLCLFIDALDECVADDLDRVVKVVKKLALHSKAKIKICVSSRPEQKINNRLRDVVFQSFDLHELTEEDIRQHVTKEFESCWQASVAPTCNQKEQLINELVRSSEGVFLWAFLVARKLCESIEFGDTISQLQAQLNELPRDMMQLYENMLHKSGATRETVCPKLLHISNSSSITGSEELNTSVQRDQTLVTK